MRKIKKICKHIEDNGLQLSVAEHRHVRRGLVVKDLTGHTIMEICKRKGQNPIATAVNINGYTPSWDNLVTEPHSSFNPDYEWKP